MIMDLERWNKELEDHDLFQPIINDLPNFCETTHETDLENDTLLFCYCMLRTHSNSIHAGLATIMGVVPVTCAQPVACEFFSVEMPGTRTLACRATPWEPEPDQELVSKYLQN